MGNTDIFKNQNFLNYISDSKKIMPLAMSIDVTNNCNFRCCHCYVKHTFSDVRLELSKEKIFDILNQMEDYGVASVYFTGGEPFLREDFIEIIEYSKALGLNTYIKTNGMLIKHEDIVRMKECNVNDIQISIYGMSNEEYALVTGNNKDRLFDRIVSITNELMEAGILVKLRYVVLKENYEGCVDFVNYCIKKGLAEDQFFHAVDIHPSSGCDITPLEHSIDVQQQKELLRRLDKISPSYVDKLYNFPKTYAKCNVGRNTIHILSDGKVIPCPGFVCEIGNIYKQSFQDIWENSPKLNELRDLKVQETACYECENNAYCKGNCMGVINNWNNHKSYKERNPRFCAIKCEQINMYKELIEEGVLSYDGRRRDKTNKDQ